MISGPASSGRRRPKRSIMYPVGTVASTPPTIGASTIRAAAATFTWNSSLAMSACTGTVNPRPTPRNSAGTSSEKTV